MDITILDFIKGLNNDFIPLPSSLWKCDFFPSFSWHFVILTDDEMVFFCSRENFTGKGIYSAQKQPSFREYFKKRLIIPPSSVINPRDLISYGRTSIDFCKIDDENYFMDFSISVRNGESNQRTAPQKHASYSLKGN